MAFYGSCPGQKKRNKFIWRVRISNFMCCKANSRLRGPSEAKADEAPQEQEPAVHWSEGTQQPKVESQAHGDHQTLERQFMRCEADMQ